MPDIFDRAASKIPLIKKLAMPALAGVGIAGIGAASGMRSYHKHSDMSQDDRLKRATSSVGTGLIYGTAGLGAAYAIAAGPIKNKMSSIAEMADKPLGSLVPKAFNNPAELSLNSASKFAKSAVGMGGAGALIGGVIGRKLDKDNPNTGTAVGAVGGAVVGVAGSAALKGMHAWEHIGPVGRVGAVLAGSAAIALGGRAMMHSPEYQSESVSESDGSGGYRNTQSSSGVKQRLNTMNAAGDIVFGLNRKR